MKYIEECKKKYFEEAKSSFTNSLNYSIQNMTHSMSNPSSNTSTPALNSNNSGKNNQNNSHSQTMLKEQKNLSLIDYLIIDDKILLETLLNTENALEKVTIPFLELEFKTKLVEMYSYCNEVKI